MAQPVTDFHINRKLASIFELKFGDGKLLVSGYDLNSSQPETEQLKFSLLRYMESDKFNPHQELCLKELNKLFGFIPPAPVSIPNGFEKAIFYSEAGGKKITAGNEPWNLKLDDIKISQGITYHVKCDGVWKDDTGTAWHGKKIEIDFNVPTGMLADIYIYTHDWNNQGRRGTLTFEGREFIIGRHDKGKWIKLSIRFFSFNRPVIDA